MPRPARRDGAETATRILDTAERLVQRFGYNAFSYADVAAELKITTASLHYHFAGKADLGSALIDRYTARFMDALSEIEADHPDAPARLHAYANLYDAALREHRLCLCGMLAADYQTLPKPMRAAVLAFFDRNEARLTRILDVGRQQGSLRFTGDASDAARMLISGLEGAMLVARPYEDPSRFTTTAAHIIKSLTGS